MFSFTIDGVQMEILDTKHSLQRHAQRGVSKFAAYGSIVAVGEDLLDMRHGEEFCVMDRELGISIVCAMHFRGLDVFIDIITVLDDSHVYVKDGTRIYKLGE
jgi:hypothetical protein